MNFLKTTILALVLGFTTLTSANSFAADEKIWTVGTDQGYVSQYLWRATNQHNDGYQGDVYVTLWDMVTFNVWWDVPTKDTSGLNTGQAYEVDYTIDFAYAIDKWSFNVGNITYDFPQTAAGSISTTNEVYLSVGYDIMLSPTLGIYYDYDKVDGIYLQFDIGHSCELSDYAALNAGVTVGYAIDEGPDAAKDASGTQYWSYYDKNSGFTSVDLSTSIDFSLAPVSSTLANVTVSPSILYSIRNTTMISGKSAGTPSYGRDDFVAAINVNLEF